jgi:LmbE family N-acetylglucosaminyl deacetylase
MPTFEPTEPILVLSTHLDDAVLSCGHFLYRHPSTTVATVLAGAPQVSHEGYNSRTTGQSYAPDAIRVRRDEDREAMELLGATPVWLDLLDADYAAFRPTGDYGDLIQAEISRVLDVVRPVSVLAPLGLIHHDHLAVSDACLELAATSRFTWYLYMDLPYALASRRALSRRLARLGRRVRLEEFDAFDGEPGMKQKAMSLYASQYGVTRETFPDEFDATMVGPERYWRMTTAR